MSHRGRRPCPGPWSSGRTRGRLPRLRPPPMWRSRASSLLPMRSGPRRRQPSAPLHALPRRSR
eukprot:1630526-Alexandrium_andersonii.AAC.1